MLVSLPLMFLEILIKIELLEFFSNRYNFRGAFIRPQVPALEVMHQRRHLIFKCLPVLFLIKDFSNAFAAGQERLRLF
jgi:hypothetical protein